MSRRCLKELVAQCETWWRGDPCDGGLLVSVCGAGVKHQAGIDLTKHWNCRQISRKGWASQSNAKAGMPPSDIMTSPSLARVARGDLCAGCGACAGVTGGKIAMQRAAPGFLRPVQLTDLSAADEATVAAICPGLGQHVDAMEREDSVLWGPMVSAEVGCSTDPEIRFAGSSGGALTAILHHLLKTGVVDAVLQSTADPNFPIGNTTVCNTDSQSILAAAGSRYAPSAPLEELWRYREDNRRFAFVGKPCDAAALRALISHDATLEQRFPVILSFFCAGVPSHSGGEAVLRSLGTTLDDTELFRFRGNGWPGDATAIAKDGTVRKMSYHDSWGKILSKHVQNRCKLCADGTGVAADIVCADAWESDEKGYPVFNDAPGQSLVVTRTRLGAALIAGARAEGAVKTQGFDMATLAAIQPGQRERRRALWARLAALRLLGRPVPHYSGLHLFAAARQNPIRRNLRNFLGTLRRALRPRG
jgi:coenzyme F420 hydrogenase subunit beta